jgi:two-component system, cell cycle sensor histidine kinase and response regulator CckA
VAASFIIIGEHVKDRPKTDQELLEEISTLKQRIRDLELLETEQRRAEKALRGSEIKLRTLYDSISDAVMLLDKKSFLDCNKAALEIYGCATRDEFCSMRPADLSPPVQPCGTDSMTLSNQHMATAFSNGRHQFEWTHKRVDTGEIFSADVLLTAMTLDDKPVLLAIIRDISERKQAEEKSRQSEDKFTKVFMMTPDGIAITRIEDGLIIDTNIGFVEISGWERSETLGRTSLELNLWVDPDDRAFMVEELKAGRDVIQHEFRFRRKDGAVRSGIYSARSIRIMEDPCLVFAMQDVTERKKAEEVSRLAEEKFTNVFMMAPDMVTITRLEDGLIADVNIGFEEITGWKQSEVIGRTSYSLGFWINPADRSAMVEELKEGGNVVHREIEFRRKDGAVRTGIYSARLIPIAGERYLMFVMQDTTEKMQMMEERMRLEQQLHQSQKMDAIGQLAGGIAHDFNNILTVITGYGNLLKMGMDKESPFQSYVDYILSSSDKAANLTRGLLAFSRQQAVVLKQLDLNESIRSAKKLLSRLLTEDIAFKTNLDNAQLIVMADATQIDQILFNLTANARDAMPKGGTMIIETQQMILDNDFIHVHGFGERGPYARLSVSDTGVGMDETTREKIFEPFFTTKGVGKGTGLGLSTVYGIVQQHNGHIAVYSEPGLGTTFHVYLPLSGQALVKEAASALVVRGGEETVLLAEDDESVRGLMQSLLAAAGYAVVEATNGEDALGKFHNHLGRIDLLVLDSIMPKKNGRETYDEIRAIEPDIKVLFVSGYTRDIILDKGIEDKAFPFVPKPLSPNEFLLKVREVLDGLPPCH